MQSDTDNTNEDITAAWGSKLRAKLNCQNLPDQVLVDKEISLLSRHFEALASYLQGHEAALRADTTLPQTTQDWLNQDGLTNLTAQSLQNIFKNAAAHHQGLMRTECVLTSAAAHKEIIANSDDTITAVPKDCHPKKMTFGFVKTTPQKDQNAPTDNEKTSGITFPIIALPSKITKIPDMSLSHPMVQTLQKLYTLTNHDWLHHMTLSALNKGVCAYKNDDKVIEKWSEKHFSDNIAEYPICDFGANETLYEGWAIYTNAQIMKKNPAGNALKDDIMTTAMQMINHGKDYIESHNNNDQSMKTAFWFIMQTTKALRSIIPVDSFEMHRFVEAAAKHLPHPDRYATQQIENIKARLYLGHGAMCMLHSPKLANNENQQKKFENFTNDNPKITIEAIAHLACKFG
jgi:hypothetical protein